MFTLLDFNQYAINEALNLTLAKYYTKLWKDAKGDKRYRKMFGGKNRIYIPLEGQSTIDHFSDIIDDIERALADLGYKLLSIEGNWAKQIKGRREKKITKVLSSDKEKRYEDLNNQYLKILDLHKRAEEDLYEIVISRHGYDIAGMSTDRGWDSCMNVLNNKNNKYIKLDIEKGTIIAYLIKKNDRNIQNARARLLIKPFVSSDGEEMVLFADETVYGTDLDGFRETVEKWLEENQTITKRRYELLKDLYDDGLSEVCNLNFIKIEDLLNDKNIIQGKWKINDDNTINVNGSVYLKNIVKGNKDSIKEILFNEYSFGIIDGSFNCYKSKLKSLEGAPKRVDGNFLCLKNKLTNLEYSPKFVGENYLCGENFLKNLKGCPEKIYGNFDCKNNNLTSLEGGPVEVKKYFDCSNNNLSTLKGGPKEVGRSYFCINNKLVTLEGVPSYIDGIFSCMKNNLTNLKGGPEVVTQIYDCSKNSLDTLDGFPKIINGDLIIDHHFPFTNTEIYQVCKIGGRIERV